MLTGIAPIRALQPTSAALGPGRPAVRAEARVALHRVVGPGVGILAHLRRRKPVALAVDGGGAVGLGLGVEGVPYRIGAPVAVRGVLDQLGLDALPAVLLAAAGLVHGIHRRIRGIV